MLSLRLEYIFTRYRNRNQLLEKQWFIVGNIYDIMTISKKVEELYGTSI